MFGLIRLAEKGQFVSQASLEWLSMACIAKCREAYILFCCMSSILDSDMAESKSTLYAMREK